MNVRLARLSVVLLIIACTAPAATTAPTGSPPAATPSISALPTDSQPAATPTAPTDAPASQSPTEGTATPTAAPSGPSQVVGWSELAAAAGPAAREDHTWTAVGDGSSALLFGGRAGRREFNDLWRYDLVADGWTQLEPAGEVPPPRFGHVAVWVDGVGLVIWSGQAGPDFFSDVWAYDPAANGWRELPAGGAIPPARYGSCGAIGPDGRLWISHGFTADTGRFADTRAYDFASSEWTDLTPEAPLPVERCLHDCLWTPDGRLLLYAGQTTGTPALGDLWAYDEATGAWTLAPTPDPQPRQLYALTVLDSAAFVFGGGAQDGALLDDLWLLDLATLEWSAAQPGGTPPAARSGSTLIADPVRGRLLLFGGKTVGGETGDLWRLELEPAD